MPRVYKRKPPRQAPTKPATTGHIAIANLMRALEIGNYTRQQLVDACGLHSSTVGRLVRAMMRPDSRCVHISSWVLVSFVPHRAIVESHRLQPAFSLGIAPDVEIPARYAHLTTTTNYD